MADMRAVCWVDKTGLKSVDEWVDWMVVLMAIVMAVL